MLCQKCKIREATCHSRYVVNGVSSEEFLCEICSKNTSNSFANFVSSMFMNSFNLFESVFDDFDECECGTSFNNIINTGKVGCNNCYTNYRTLLNKAMDSINNGVEKQREIMKSSNYLKMTGLKTSLQEAVKNEDYERAVEIKKEIDKLEKGDEF